MSRFFMCAVFILCIQTNVSLKCDEMIYLTYVNNLGEIVGNWIYLYHLEKADHAHNTVPLRSLLCAEIEISNADKDYVEAKRASCGRIYVPFNWNDVKLKITAPGLKFNALIVAGIDQYVMETCGKYAVVEVLRINNNLILLVNQSEKMMELLGKKIPTREELSCLIEKLERTKYFENVTGKAYCFQ